MGEPEGHHRPPRRPSGRTNLASCVVATLFLLLVLIVLLIVYFTVFKPTDLKISVTAVQLPSFSAVNNTVNFTFSQYIAVKNPNRATFSHYDSTIQLLYSGSQVGFMFIPAGKIESGRTQYLSATFAVNSFPLSAPPAAIGFPGLSDEWPGYGYGYGNRVGPTLEIESTMEMGGRVRVLHIFTHHVEGRIECKVTLAANDGTVLGFHC